MKKNKRVLSWKTKVEKRDYLDALMGSKKKEAISYIKENEYKIGDFISHPKFGQGFIHNIMNKNKIEVYFNDSEKILVQNW